MAVGPLLVPTVVEQAYANTQMWQLTTTRVFRIPSALATSVEGGFQDLVRVGLLQTLGHRPARFALEKVRIQFERNPAH